MNRYGWSYRWPTVLWCFCLIMAAQYGDWLTAGIVLLLAPLAMWYEQKLYDQQRKQP